MQYKTVAEYKKEIARVRAALDSTSSSCLRRDYGKYLKRLQKEMRGLRE
jgi:hypothetical protein